MPTSLRVVCCLALLSTAACSALFPNGEEAGPDAGSAGTPDAALDLPEVTLPRNLEATRGEFPDKIVLTWIAGTPGPWKVYRCNSNEIPCAGTAYAYLGDVPEGATTFEDTAPPQNVFGQYYLRMKLTSVNQTSEYSSGTCWGYAAGTLAGPTDMTASTDTRTDGVELSATAPWLCPQLASGCDVTVLRAPAEHGPWTPIKKFSQQTYTFVDTSAAGGVTYYYKALASYDPPTLLGGVLNSADSNLASGRRAKAADGSTSWGHDPMARDNGVDHGFFRDPRQIAVDSAGFVYVAEWYPARVQKFTAEGVFVTTFGDHLAQEEFGSRRLVHPWGVAVDAEGDLFIADNDADSGGWRARVVRLSSTGDFEAEWDQVFDTGIAAQGLGQLAIDVSGRVWAAISAPGPGLVVWDRDGTTLLQTDGTGPNCSQKISQLVDLQADPAGGVWITGVNGSRKYDASGMPVDCGTIPLTQAPYARTALFHPNGSLYVGSSSDLEDNALRDTFKMLHRIGADGTALASWGPWGTGSEKLFDVKSIAAAPDGSLYVLDGLIQNDRGYRGNRMVVHLPAF